MTVLHIQLLGGFRLTYDDQPVTTLNQARVQSLLAYLLIHRQVPQARHHLAFTFWPDVSEAQARNNLRQMLHQLRNHLPNAEQFLQADANRVHWLSNTPFRLDVAEFEEAMTQVSKVHTTDSQTTLHILQTAIDRYPGDLFPSCYDEWIAPVRERLRQQAMQVLQRLVRLREELRDYTSALLTARRLLQFDLLEESTYLCLMRLHALNNDRVSGLRVYQDCVTILQRELDVEPGPDIQFAYQRLLHHHSVSPTAPSPATDTLPLIGRQSEWKELHRAWERAMRQHPQLLIITGEAGIGKSRLAEELFDWLNHQGIATARTRAYAAEGRLSYGAIGEWLRQPMLASSITRLDKVWLTEIARLLPELLTEYADLPPPTPLTEYWQRQRFFEALARAILAGNQPLLLLIDDLQWCDPETLEWLHFLLRFDPKARLLILGTARSEEMNTNPALLTLVHATQAAAQLVTCVLNPLDAAEVAKLATTIVDRELEVAETMRLFRETEGNPLFVVEMVRAGLEQLAAESGQWRSFTPSFPVATAPSTLPPKIYAVIAHRLHQLSALARQLIGVAATIGRGFTLDVLVQVCDQDEERLVDALDELWQRRIIREQGTNVYDFSHDKLRDVAYSELSPMQRRRLHRRVAQALETIFASELDSISGQLAAHYEHSGIVSTAIIYYQRAGAIAQRIYANAEAISLYQKGLTLLATLPERSERHRHELGLQIALVVPLATNAGYGASSLIAACQQARRLAQQLGEPDDPSVLRALAIGSVSRLEFGQAQELGVQLLALAESNHDLILFTEAYYVLGVTSFFQGEFGAARAQLEQAIAHYTVAHSPIHISRYAQDPKVVCLCRLALTLWYLGYADQAAQAAQAALTFAEQLAHPFSLVYCLYWNAMVQQHRRQPDVMLARLESGFTLIETHQLGTFSHWMTSLRGWALAQAGNVEEGMRQLHASIELARQVGTRNNECFNLGLLAEQYANQGEFVQALTLLDETLVRMNETGEHWREAEVYRWKGQLLLQGHGLDQVHAAESMFRHAISLAQRQEAKALELRAIVSLARLWHSAGRDADARQLLTPIYAWFTEGFAAPDLVEARLLLEALSPAVPATSL